MNEPRCRHLRTKKMYLPGHVEWLAEAEQDNWANDFFWCNRTLTEIGCDDQPVHPRLCTACRACFEA